MLTLIYFILILGLIVLVHEFGHFIFAKMFGVHVYEFSIGMGPKLIGTKEKKGKTSYSVRLFPIGGYVQLAGEDVTEEDKELPKGSRLYERPAWQRFLILFFGAGNNFILAFILLLGIGLFHGSQIMDPVITNLSSDGAMIEAGFMEGDEIVSINGNKISNIDDAKVFLTLENDGTETTFVVKRNNENKEIKVTPKKEVDEKTKKESYKYGIVFEERLEHGIGSAFSFAFKKFGAFFKQIIVTFKYLFTGKLGLNNLSGPVGIYSIVGNAAKDNVLLNLANLTALLCINIGFLNLIPFPAFDGGRILFLLIEKIKGKPLNPKIESTVNAVGFCLLLLLIAVITVSDIIKLF